MPVSAAAVNTVFIVLFAQFNRLTVVAAIGWGWIIRVLSSAGPRFYYRPAVLARG